MEVAGKVLNEGDETIMFCEPCKVENSKYLAEGACRECKENMCATCFRHHLKSKHSRNHGFLSLAKLSSLKSDIGSEDVTKCEKHDNEVIKFYCRSHDIVGCGDCIVLEHTSCKPEYIKDLAKTFIDGDLHKDILKRIVELEEMKTDYGKEVGMGKDETERKSEAVLKEIQQFRSKINKCLDKAQVNIISILQSLNKENKRTLVEVETDLDSLSSDLERLKQKMDTQLHSMNALFINAVNSKSKLSDMEKKFNNTTRNKMIKMIEFVSNKRMSDLLKSAEPMGNLKSYSKANKGSFYQGFHHHQGNRDSHGRSAVTQNILHDHHLRLHHVHPLDQCDTRKDCHLVQDQEVGQGLNN